MSKKSITDLAITKQYWVQFKHTCTNKVSFNTDVASAM